MSLASVMPSSHLILWCPLLPSIFPSIRDFSNESAFHTHQMTKTWSFSFNVSPSEYLGLMSLKMDCFDLAVQGTLRNLPQHHSLKASFLCHSAFFMVQLWTTIHDHWEDHSLDYMDFYWQSNVSAFQHCLAFLLRSKCLLISWPQSSSAVILEPRKRKAVTTTFSPSICREVMGRDAMILVFLVFILSWLFHSPPSPSSRVSLVPFPFLHI